MSARTIAKTAAGLAADWLFPSLASEIEAGNLGGRNERLKRLILHARLKRANWRRDDASSSELHAGIWTADTAIDFYDTYSERFRQWFHGPHHVIVDQMAELDRARHFRHLVEIGCGDGQALAHCAAAMRTIEKLTGVDINPEIIARNRGAYGKVEPRLDFSAGKAADWLAAHASDDMLLFSYGGVMEYIDPGTLADMFAALFARRNVAVALVEPVDPAHDLEHDAASHIFGDEHSFSHNHARLLDEAGFEILFHEEIRTGRIRWVMILAASKSGV